MFVCCLPPPLGGADTTIKTVQQGCGRKRFYWACKLASLYSNKFTTPRGHATRQSCDGAVRRRWRRRKNLPRETSLRVGSTPASACCWTQLRGCTISPSAIRVKSGRKHVHSVERAKQLELADRARGHARRERVRHNHVVALRAFSRRQGCEHVCTQMFVWEVLKYPLLGQSRPSNSTHDGCPPAPDLVVAKFAISSRTQLRQGHAKPHCRCGSGRREGERRGERRYHSSCKVGCWESASPRSWAASRSSQT